MILDFYYLKGILELVGQRMNLKGLDFLPADHPVFQPGQSARIMIEGREIGFAGTVADSILDNYSLPVPVYLAELDLLPFLEAGGCINVLEWQEVATGAIFLAPSLIRNSLLVPLSTRYRQYLWT